MRFNKKAFTLTELLIALGVIGVLAAILMPVITNMMPDQNAIMAKRAYYTVQNVVSDMINNGDCYPDTSKAASDSFRRIGFDDGFPYPNCEKWKGDPYLGDVCQDLDNDGECDKDAEDQIIWISHDGDSNEGDAGKKFSDIFKNTVDLKEEITSTNRFTTKDGIDWQFSNLDHFKNFKNDASKFAIVYIDINGEKGPNRRDTGEYLSTLFDRSVDIKAYDEDNPATYDVFSMEIYEDGRVTIRDEWAKRAVDINNDLQEYEY